MKLITMAQPAKRAKVTLHLKEKVEILAKLDKGVLGSVLAIEYGVTKSTISYIKSKKSLKKQAVRVTILLMIVFYGKYIHFL